MSVLIYLSIYLSIYRVSQKYDIILKVNILKTTQSSSMKLKSLRVEHYMVILGPISQESNMCTACDTTHIKSVVNILWAFCEYVNPKFNIICLIQ